MHHSPSDHQSRQESSAPPRPTVLGELRRLIPNRQNISFDDALRVAELQAYRLHELLEVLDVTELQIAGLPRIRVARETLPTSGSSHWNGREWIICLNATDTLPRQRFTLLHEFKHIIDHGAVERLYGYGALRSVAAERAADYFAGCALVPKQQLKTAWGNGLQDVAALAEHFGVSRAALEVRLAQTGLDRESDREPSPRCMRPIRTPRSAPQQFIYARGHA